jgi:hypothetical protein
MTTGGCSPEAWRGKYNICRSLEIRSGVCAERRVWTGLVSLVLGGPLDCLVMTCAKGDRRPVIKLVVGRYGVLSGQSME